MNPITAVSPPEVARPSLETALPSDPGDPTAPMAMHIEIARIQPYPRNPRRVRNAEYEAIKASIRVNGMSQPLVVTRVPGDDTFTVSAGGNTRLQILGELYRETGEDQFRLVHCHFVPWTSETEVILAHLRENDLRGPLLFIDRARAIREVQRLIEAEARTALSLRRLSETLAERGYQVSPGLLSQMAYAVDTLLPLIPQALEAGMGQPQVQRIRSLENAGRRLWDGHLPEEDSFEPTFATLCQRHDGPEWDLQRLRRALELEIAERAEVSVHQISLGLDALLHAHEAEPVELVLAIGAVDDSIDSDVQNIAAGPALGPDQRQETSADDDIDAAERLITTGRPGPTDLKSLRARAWTLAARLAQRHGIAELVRPLSGQGLGYVLTDVPPPELAELLDADELARVGMLWWQLAACAELTVAPPNALLPILAEDSVLRWAIERQQPDLLFGHVWTLDPSHIGDRLWRQLDERGWQDLVNLMDTYRAIHRAATETSTALWA